MNSNEDFEVTESLVNLNHHFIHESTSVIQFTNDHMFSSQDFEDFLHKFAFKNRRPWLKSINLLYKKELMRDLLELYDHIEHTESTLVNFQCQNRVILLKQQRLENAAQAEKDLEDQKMSLNQLTKINRPFLVSGKTGLRTSKHILCRTQKKSKNVQSKLNTLSERSEAGEMKLSLLKSI